MSEMVERVAFTLQGFGFSRAEEAIAAARAVIQAMRAPTPDMIAAANRNNHPRDIETWHTMIDVALGRVQ